MTSASEPAPRARIRPGGPKASARRGGAGLCTQYTPVRLVADVIAQLTTALGHLIELCELRLDPRRESFQFLRIWLHVTGSSKLRDHRRVPMATRVHPDLSRPDLPPDFPVFA